MVYAAKATMLIDQSPSLLSTIMWSIIKTGGIVVALGYIYPHLAKAISAIRLF